MNGAAGGGASVYHVELRQFPHNVCRFNLDERELLATIVEPWAREQWVELGERKWSPQQAKLTVIAGESIPPAKLTMGRGWRVAQRGGREVTRELLAAARVRQAPGSVDALEGEPRWMGERTGENGHAQGSEPLADSLGLELLAALADGPAPLQRAWELAAERDARLSPSACLALAERAVVSLVRARLVVLVRSGQGGSEPVDTAELDAVLRAIGSWCAPRGCDDHAAGVWLRKV